MSHYKVIKLLGEGSFSKAYLCQKGENESLYVIKQIIVEGMSQKEKDDIFNEAKILAELDLPNIIKLYEVFYAKMPKHSLNLIREYADDGNLSEKIKSQNNKPFTESEILDYFIQICSALKYIHDKKIIHRNLTSQKVFLMKSGLVKLSGFGFSKGYKNILNKAYRMVGVPYYKAPEILENKPYDAKSDIWSLGVLLYEMMTFKMPFNANSLPMFSIKIMRGQYTPPSNIYTKDLREIVSKCLMIDPKRRPTIVQILSMPIIQHRMQNFKDSLSIKNDINTNNIIDKDKKILDKEEEKEEEEEKEKEKEKKDNK